MLRVGLTGNIASGKSHVARVFGELGVHVIDADVIAHDLLLPGRHGYARVVQSFGREILDPGGTINRKRLGAVVFADSERRAALNSIVHPEVRREILRRIRELEEGAGAGIVMVDAALMVESGSYELYDRIVVVKCAPALQLRRLMDRGGLGEADARARIASQMPWEEKARHAHYVIDTSGSLRETREQVETVYRDLARLASKLRNG